MTETQRRSWARAVVKYPPPPHMYAGLTFAEVSLRAKELTTAACQLDVWTHLADHLVLIHIEMLKRSRS